MSLFRRYELGTEVQEKSGRVKKKIEDLDGAKWVGRNRYNWMQHHKKELGDNDKVYHIDGDKSNDDPSNLVAIKFSGVKYSLKHSRVVWEPKGGEKHYKPWVVAKKLAVV